MSRDALATAADLYVRAVIAKQRCSSIEEKKRLSREKRAAKGNLIRTWKLFRKMAAAEGGGA